LSSIRETDKSFGGLFGRRFEHDSSGNSDEDTSFAASYGWIYNATKVAAHQRIELDKVWQLSYVEFLNALSYLKALNQLEAEQMKRK
jgi:hypothetical protein